VLPTATPTFAVLASGQGGNFEALALASRRGDLPARCVLLASDRAEARALDRARRLGIESIVLPVGSRKTRAADERAWALRLRDSGVNIVLLAGFMRRLHAEFLSEFPDRILNIHPSLLPSFPGLDAIRRALEHGVRVTGCTVHLVDEDLDQGPIVAQAAVEVGEHETLASLEARIHEAEHRLYPAAVRRFLSEPSRRVGRRLVFGSQVESEHA
jgi:phosphoribosylglycinamide formyltransferase-1